MIARLMLILALMASLIVITVPASAELAYVPHPRLNTNVVQPLVRLASNTATGGSWYIVTNKEGTTKISEKKPGLGWAVSGGPYNSWDQAARSGGVAPNGSLSVGPFNR